jgi:hypothetical protein
MLLLWLWVFMGLFAGYSSSCLYKIFRDSEWKNVTIKTGLMFPGVIFAMFFVLNAVIWGEKLLGYGLVMLQAGGRWIVWAHGPACLDEEEIEKQGSS